MIKMRNICDDKGFIIDIEPGPELPLVYKLLKDVYKMRYKEISDRFDEIAYAIDYCVAVQNNPKVRLIGMHTLGYEVEKYIRTKIDEVKNLIGHTPLDVNLIYDLGASVEIDKGKYRLKYILDEWEVW